MVRGSLQPARAWHGTTAAVGAASLILDVLLVLFGTGVPLGDRVVRFVSYFTVQSNVIVTLIAVLLTIRPDRNGAVFRALRLDALLCITVTGVVHFFLLRPIQHLEGWDAVGDVGLHIAVPLLTVVGWVLFGPRPRVAGATLLGSLIYPVLWVIYTFARGAVAGWYPYPFLDVGALGYGRAILDAIGVAVVFLVLGGIVWAIDGRLFSAPSTPTVASASAP